MSAEVRSLAWVRACARAPRYSVVVAAIVLSLVGVRALLAAPPTATVAAAPRGGPPAEVGAFAEAFAREYLSWQPGDIAEREARLASFLAAGLDPDAGLVTPTDGEQSVVWTSIAQVRPTGRSRWAARVVAALGDGRRVSLDIPIVHAREALAVGDYPAPASLAGGAHGLRAMSPRDPVQDGELELVVRRAVRNFLAVRTQDLLADLAPGARVLTPDAPTRLLTVEELHWTQPGEALAALVQAELPGGATARLRVHLRVRREGRWFITAFTTPTHPTQGAHRP